MASWEPQHADILAALRDLHQHQLFTDFTLLLKEGAVHVSRILLAAMSPVFRTMLTTDMTETRNNTVDMPHITMETWTCITHFYFSSQKLVSVENVVDIVEASHMYGLERLKEYCSDFLISVCSPDNCLSVQRMAAKFELKSVARAATGALAENFSAVCQCEEFLSLEKAELVKFLEEEELVTTEDDLFQALLAWMENNKADVDTCMELFQHVRLEKLSDVCLWSHIMYHNVLTRTSSLQAAVQQEVGNRMVRSPYRQDQTVPQRRPRQCNTPRSLLSVGHNTEDEFCMLQWSLEEKRWMRCPGPEEIVASVFSASVFQNTVVVTGGWQSKKTFLYDTETRTWTAGPDLLQARGYHGMAVIKDKVYVVAGYVDFVGLSSIEEYSQASGQWTHSGDLQVKADCCGVTSLGSTIFVVGGDTQESARLIQTFNVETRTAAVLDIRLPRPMRHVRAARLGSIAFFVGEEGDLVQMREVDGTFQMTSHVLLQEFESKKLWFGLHVTDDCVRVIGGTMSISRMMRGNKSKSVECWNYQGGKTQNDEVEDLPEEMDVHALLETGVPSH